MSRALKDVASERTRQQDVEGFTIARDDTYQEGVLAIAGACYALECLEPFGQAYRWIAYDKGIPKHWPIDVKWWKPKDTRSNLVRAAALIVAEIERLDRAVGERAE